MELTRNQNGGQNMLYNYFTEKLLGLQGVLIENIEEIDDTIHIYCKLERKIHKCPVCGNHTDKIHDYREQIIKDIPAFGKFVFIHLKKRRYSCSCGKRFYEKNSFLPRFHRMTNRLVAYVIDKLRCEASFTSVAKEVNLSLPTVIRIFDLVSYSLKELPTALSIDEFKGNTGKEKYQCILTDPENYAFESVRKEEQKKFSKSHCRYFKNSRKLLLKRFDDLNDEQKQQVNIMLYTSPNLCTAHFYKEDFLKILDCQDRQSAKKAMSDWINSAYDCGIPRFVKCAKTMQNWLTGILDSFTTPLTNGFIEGCNNKIKVLKRNAYGYRDFNRFRNRILHMFSLKSAKNNTKQAAV